ncbi:hypothetical protein GCM10010214_19790 [Streptomyces abikoensis]|nr:hypothetical protein GCM10010214_19790 [Streptomyces abikoensis]
MTSAFPLDRLLGCERAAAYLRQLADKLACLDHLDPATALKLVCERVTDGDPLLMASHDQVWRLRDCVSLDEAPAHRLTIHARLTCPPRVLVSDTDDEIGAIDEFPIEVLHLYQLDSWRLELTAPPWSGPRASG